VAAAFTTMSRPPSWRTASVTNSRTDATARVSGQRDDRCSAGFPNILGGRSETCLIARDQSNGRTFCHETLRDRLADATASAGDEGGLAAEFQIHLLLPTQGQRPALRMSSPAKQLFSVVPRNHVRAARCRDRPPANPYRKGQTHA